MENKASQERAIRSSVHTNDSVIKTVEIYKSLVLRDTYITIMATSRQYRLAK